MAEETPLPEQGAVSPEVQAEFETETETAQTPDKPKKKRRIRTGPLFAAALTLGVLGGIAGGYVVQARREPTPLPALRVAVPVYPRSPLYDGMRPPALPANVDDATIVDGDLTKLLLPTPAGAKATFNDHGWMTLIDEADTCVDPASCFSINMSDNVARIADTAWNLGDGTYVEIRMFQYRPGHSDRPDYNLTSFSVPDGHELTLPAGIPASGYEYKDSNGQNDDHAMAMHGDVAVYFWVTSSTRVPDPSIINNLITQQMARL